jgi:hypothetical protein
VCAGIPNLASLYNLSLVASKEVPLSPTVGDVLPFAELLALDTPDIIVMCGYLTGCTSWTKAMRMANLNPKQQVFTVCIGNEECVRAKRARERSERNREVFFGGGSKLRRERAKRNRQKQTRSASATKMLSFCGGRKRAVLLGGCRGETPRTPPAAGGVAHALGCTRARLHTRSLGCTRARSAAHALARLHTRSLGCTRARSAAHALARLRLHKSAPS